MDEHEPRVRRNGPLEQLEGGRDAGEHPVDLGAPWDLEPVGAVIREGAGVQQLVEEGDDLVCGGQKSIRKEVSWRFFK